MVFQIDSTSLMIGLVIAFGVWLIITLIFKLFIKKKKNQTKTSLPQLKSYVKEAHNHMVESANNLIKLYEVFNEIEETKQ